MHFHFFIVMALLVIYSDWRLGWLVLVLTSLHHTILNYVQPTWVYSYGRNDLSIIAHGVPVLVMAIFTTRLCETQRSAVEALAKTSAALQQDNLARPRAEAALRHAHDRQETRVQERTAELSAANAALQVEVAEREHADENVRQAQRRFRALIEHSADAVSLLDPQGILTYTSPAATGVLGYAVEDLVGRSMFDLLHPDDLPRIGAIFAGLLEQPGATAAAEYRMRHQDGSWRWVEGTGTNLLAEPGVQGIVANYHDITERHEAAEKLAAQHEEIRATTQQLWQTAKLATMGELVAGIAHELNNPLATISLRLEAVLAQLPDGDPRRRPLEVVQQEAERMAALVASLLQLGRRGQMQVSTLDVAGELSQALELMHYHLAQRQISLETEFDPGAPRVLADRQQLRQVFLNLLTNAADAMPAGGRLAVRVAGGGPADPDMVTVEVADTGGGIAPENLALVWEPFFTTKPEGKGTGLGLSICRHILQEHGATINLESRLGQGTTARVRLPVQAPERFRSAAQLQSDAPTTVGPTPA
jgi:PAS domain S-box-containing protein